jgi:hypothetical protein
MHDPRLSYARELGTTLGEASYEVPRQLVGLLGARSQVPGVPEAHVCALEVPHECANQVIPVVDLTGQQMLEPCPSRVREVQRKVTDDHFISGGTSQLARQAIVVQPYTRARLPLVLVGRGGLAEALREAPCAHLSAERTGPRGLRRRRAIQQLS